MQSAQQKALSVVGPTQEVLPARGASHWRFTHPAWAATAGNQSGNFYHSGRMSGVDPCIMSERVSVWIWSGMPSFFHAGLKLMLCHLSIALQMKHDMYIKMLRCD